MDWAKEAICGLAAALMLCCGTSGNCCGQVVTATDIQLKLERQAAEIDQLEAQLFGAASDFGHVQASYEPAGCDGCEEVEKQRIPVFVEQTWEPECDDPVSAPKFHTLRFYADYDDGFVIRPYDPEEDPFELQVNGWIQFRHHAMSQDVVSWTDNAGVTRPLRNRNAFDIERGRLIFSGYALDERLTYFLQLDGDTDGEDVVDFFDYWWAWRFSEWFQFQMGKRKVPASRQWLLTARRTRFIDRPMADDFFRPDRTVGVFALGKIGQTGHYEAMVGNGYRTANLPPSGIDDHFTFAATNYFDPLGDYGGQLVDYANTPDPLVRVGHSFVFSPQAGDALGVPLDEADFVRLTDGTILTQPGALAPGVTVSEFDIYLYGIDLAFKWHGYSINAEVFFRWIEQLQGDGALPVSDLFQKGFYVEGGRFLIPKKLDVNVRCSQVSGLYGDAWEYAGGFNWYPLDSPHMKVSFDVTSLDGSPLQNTTSDILVGDDGTLFRSQFQAEF
jgi:hypothetical protein